MQMSSPDRRNVKAPVLLSRPNVGEAKKSCASTVAVPSPLPETWLEMVTEGQACSHCARLRQADEKLKRVWVRGLILRRTSGIIRIIGQHTNSKALGHGLENRATGTFPSMNK